MKKIPAGTGCQLGCARSRTVASWATVDAVLKWFVRVWVGVAIAVNVAAIGGFLLTASSFWAGVMRVAAVYSPLNPMNLLMEAILFAPAIAVQIWLDRRRKKTRSIA